MFGDGGGVFLGVRTAAICIWEENMVAYCKDCKDTYTFVLLYTYTNFCNDEPFPIEYNLAKCERCGNPAVLIREDYGGGFEGDDYYRLYPLDERRINYRIPEKVKSSYSDAVKCEKAKAWTATVVMVGRSLEAICRDFCPARKDIYKALAEMKEKGVISEELLSWANELRVLRNIGAHVSDLDVTETDANESLDFIGAIMDNIYHLRPKFEAMKERHKAKSV